MQSWEENQQNTFVDLIQGFQNHIWFMGIGVEVEGESWSWKWGPGAGRCGQVRSRVQKRVNLLLYTARPWTRPGPAPFSTVKIVVWTRPPGTYHLVGIIFSVLRDMFFVAQSGTLDNSSWLESSELSKTTPQGGPGGSRKLYLQVSSWSSTRIVIKVWDTYIGWNVP